MRFEHTKVFNFDGCIRGMRNPLESWCKSDTNNAWDVVREEMTCSIGPNDMKLMQNLLKAAIKEGNSHSKFMRQILVSVDITAPMYWWSEFDTYKVGTVANSSSKMHRLSSTPITLDCFETGDYNPDLVWYDSEDEYADVDWEISSDDDDPSFINFLESLRLKYLETKNKRYWKELLRWLPESWLQTRTVTFNYQVIRQMYFDRRNHKLTEWSKDFVGWVKTLPYAEELIMYEGDKQS